MPVIACAAVSRITGDHVGPRSTSDLGPRGLWTVAAWFGPLGEHDKGEQEQWRMKPKVSIPYQVQHGSVSDISIHQIQYKIFAGDAAGQFCL